MINRFLDFVTDSIDNVAAILFLLMAAIVSLQVLFRYVLNVSFTGSEEAARYMLVYVVMLGSAAAVRRESHMSINYFYNKFSARGQVVLFVFRQLVILSLSLILVVKGLDLAHKTMAQTTPSLNMPKGLVIYAFPLGAALMSLYSVSKLSLLVKKKYRVAGA